MNITQLSRGGFDGHGIPDYKTSYVPSAAEKVGSSVELILPTTGMPLERYDYMV